LLNNIIQSSSFSLLREIRDVMASGGAAKSKLNSVVNAISAGLGVNVCSVYLLRAGDVLELFANIGFRENSVHKVRLGIGRGLIGEVASIRRPINLEDAKSHPSFVYMPETGEDDYNSFLGVPIIRSNELLGVLVIQDKQQRQFDEITEELMQTISMVVAELIAAGDLIGKEELEKGGGNVLFPQHFIGTKLSPGVAKGVAVIHEPVIEVTQYIADDINVEKARMAAALKELRGSIDKLVESHSQSTNTELIEIMEAYRMFAYDKGWAQKINEGIETGLTAEAAVKMAQEQIKLRLEKAGNEYLRERAHDIENLGNRMLQILAGNIKVSSSELLKGQDFILVARHIGPAEFFDYDRNHLKGLIVEDGSATSHIIIIARNLDIPVVGRIKHFSSNVRNGDRLIINGDGGEVYLRPTSDIERAFDAHIKGAESRRLQFARVRDLPAVTLDGVKVSINMNAGLFIDLNQLDAAGADGIGLYRTELPFMMAKSFPDVKTQSEMYQQVFNHCGTRRIIFRTFDIGGDKKVDYIYTPPEENPAMGWRAARIAIDRPSIIRTQMRALINASAGHELNIMFPFIAAVSEFDALKRIFLAELNDVKRGGGLVPASVRYGAMIEVPSILFDLDRLFQRLDFVSIGSNDLMQFMFACDRNSQIVADRYSAVNHSMLGVLDKIITTGKNHKNVEIGFCGEMASRPVQAMCLLAFGFRNFSMPASAIGESKAMIRSLHLANFRKFFEYAIRTYEVGLEDVFYKYAIDNNILV